MSFYNQTGDVAIQPTPVVGVLGVLDDVARRTPMAWGPDGELIYLLGATRDELGGSEWAHVVHGHLGGMPPHVDLAAEQVLAQILVAGSRDGLLTAAHDVSEGGDRGRLVEMALRAGIGAAAGCPTALDPFVFCSPSRPRGRSSWSALRGSAVHRDVRCPPLPGARIGVVDSGLGADSGLGDQVLQLDHVWGTSITWTLGELRSAHTATLPAFFGD